MNWLFLRGLVRQKEHWDHFPKMFQKIPGIGRIVCLDLPGVGTENGRIFMPILSDVVRDIRNRFLKDEENHRGDWGILGHSLGGMIALQWAHDYADDFKKIVCLSTSSKECSILKRLTPFSIQSVARIFLEKDIVVREKKILELVSNLKKDDPHTIQLWLDIAKKDPLYRHVAVEQLLGAAFFKLPKKIPARTLLLASRADRMVNYTCSQWIAKKHNLPLHIHPTSGHDLALDDPDWVIEKVSQWLET